MTKPYATSNVPLPNFDDLDDLPAPRKPPVETKLQKAMGTHSLQPSKPASEAPSLPTQPAPLRQSIETRTLDRLEQQNQDLRELLNKQSLIIIEARSLLSTLTRDLVVNKRENIKQTILELNKVLEPASTTRLAHIYLKPKE